jgi:hypothetical protein
MKKTKQITDLLEELERHQQQKLMKLALEFIPNITEEDILQPNDYAILENNPLFRYEEGFLHGIKSTIQAIKALECDIRF